MPPRNVVPKPLQQPHPPLWVAATRRETIRLAAEQGIGALSFTFADPEETKAWVDEYYDIITSDRCVPAGFAINPNIAVALPMMVHADEAQAIERGIDGAHFFAYARGHYEAFGEHEPGRTSIWDEFLARREDVGFARSAIAADGAPLSVKILNNGLASLRGAIGTPAQVRELIGRYEQAGVDELMLCVQTGKTTHNDIMEALELFAAEVMPEFAQRRPAREEAKRELLGDAPRRALERRAPRKTVARGYAFKADADGGDAQATAVAGPGTRRGRQHAAGAEGHRRRPAPDRWRPAASRPSSPSCGARATSGSRAPPGRLPASRSSSPGWSASSSPSALPASPATSSTTCARPTARCAPGRSPSTATVPSRGPVPRTPPS